MRGRHRRCRREASGSALTRTAPSSAPSPRAVTFSRYRIRCEASGREPMSTSSTSFRLPRARAMSWRSSAGSSGNYVCMTCSCEGRRAPLGAAVAPSTCRRLSPCASSGGATASGPPSSAPGRPIAPERGRLGVGARIAARASRSGRSESARQRCPRRSRSSRTARSLARCGCFTRWALPTSRPPCSCSCAGSTRSAIAPSRTTCPCRSRRCG